MLQFAISNLESGEASFDLPAPLGCWEFRRVTNYETIVQRIQEGACGNTYLAANEAIDFSTREQDFELVCNEFVDISLVLSFIHARCVTATGTVYGIPMLSLGDAFMRARAIDGFEPLHITSLATVFASWAANYSRYVDRGLRLQLSHWLSGLTCFTIEDMYLSAGVQMDIVKQQERIATGNNRLTYFEGMDSASTRYGITPLGSDYKNMRNDIVHEGKLSGSNFNAKSKAECAAVVADTMNWLDLYVLNVLGMQGHVGNLPRWKGPVLENFLPAISVR